MYWSLMGVKGLCNSLHFIVADSSSFLGCKTRRGQDASWGVSILLCRNKEVSSRKLVKTLLIKTNKYPSIVYVIDIYVRMQGFAITYHE